MNNLQKPKLLIILGPTASGKSALGVEIAEKFGGEIISADSRQVYKDLDIGTGKITHEEMHGIPHHLLDVADPTVGSSDPHHFSVVEWKKLAEKAIEEITSRGNLPIVVGGTGFYIEALVDNIILPDVPANTTLRAELEKIATTNPSELMEKLEALDPDRASEIDPKNTRRVVRAIEIATALGNVPKPQKNEQYDTLMIGITTPDDILRRKIHDRVLARLTPENDMIAEAKNSGLSYERMTELGLEYRYIAEFLQSDQSLATREHFITTLTNQTWQYARRQKTWFKRDKRIEWMELNQKDQMIQKIERWLNL